MFSEKLLLWLPNSNLPCEDEDEDEDAAHSMSSQRKHSFYMGSLLWALWFLNLHKTGFSGEVTLCSSLGNNSFRSGIKHLQVFVQNPKFLHQKKILIYCSWEILMRFLRVTHVSTTSSLIICPSFILVCWQTSNLSRQRPSSLINWACQQVNSDLCSYRLNMNHHGYCLKMKTNLQKSAWDQRWVELVPWNGKATSVFRPSGSHDFNLFYSMFILMAGKPFDWPSSIDDTFNTGTWRHLKKENRRFTSKTSHEWIIQLIVFSYRHPENWAEDQKTPAAMIRSSRFCCDDVTSTKLLHLTLPASYLASGTRSWHMISLDSVYFVIFSHRTLIMTETCLEFYMRYL